MDNKNTKAESFYYSDEFAISIATAAARENTMINRTYLNGKEFVDRRSADSEQLDFSDTKIIAQNIIGASEDNADWRITYKEADPLNILAEHGVSFKD